MQEKNSEKQPIDMDKPLPGALAKTAIDPEVITAAKERALQFAKTAVSVRLKNFGRYLSEGLSPNDAAIKAGYPNAVTAMNSLARVEFTMNLRQALAEKNLDVSKLAEELDWGLKKTKSANNFKGHSFYVGKLLQAFESAYPADLPSKAPKADTGDNAFEKFQEYMQHNLPQKEAGLVIKAIRGFIENSE